MELAYGLSTASCGTADKDRTRRARSAGLDVWSLTRSRLLWGCS